MAVYYGDDDQTLDFRTFQDHAAPDTTSNLLFKGAVGGRSRSVYTGLIRVRPEGRGTNAFQTNRTIKLSEHAWAESVPNLEIENNDVHCSHASAVGPIDEEQRFYLESRACRPTSPSGSSSRASSSRCCRRCRPPTRRSAVWTDHRRPPPGRSPRSQVAIVTAQRVCAVADVASGTARQVVVDGQKIAVVRIDDDWYALGDTCTHQKISLAEGEVHADDPRDRVLEARQLLLARDGRAQLAAGHPARARLRRHRRRRRRPGRRHGLDGGGRVMSELRIENLQADVAGRRILDGIDLTVRSGEVHAVMGPNGSGKSTLSHVVMGRPGYTVTGGSVTLVADDGDELDVLALEPWERAQAGLFLAMQYPTEVPGVSLESVLIESAEAAGRDPRAVRGALVAEAERIGFGEQFLDRPLNVDLSGGEKKRNETLQLAVLEPRVRHPRRARLGARHRRAARPAAAASRR